MHPGSSSASGLYRETIRVATSGERKYIRYFNGRGHFGHVCLQLIPRPGTPCSISVDTSCHLPEESCVAAQTALRVRFDHGPVRGLPLIGIEVRLTGGTHLPRHSYPDACAIAASMAYDEALRGAAPLIMEPYLGLRLLVEGNSLQRTMRTLAALLGEVRATYTVTNVARLEAEIPVRLECAVRSAPRLGLVETFALPKDRQYRPLSAFGRTLYSFPDALDEWT